MSRRIPANWGRFDGPGRLAGIDLARGLAVVGMLAAHLLVIPPLVFAQPATWADVVNGRSSILFATLAGVSIALVTGGRIPLHGGARVRASARLAVRAGLLWALGLLLIATGVPVFVILPAYAILFLLALFFLGLRAPALFAIAAVVAVVMPFVQVLLDAAPFWITPVGVELGLSIGWNYPFTTWIAFLLAGMAIGRTDLRSPRVATVLLAVGGVLAVLGYGLHAVGGGTAAAERRDYGAAVWTARAHSTGLLEVVGSGGFAIAVIGLCLLLCRTALRWPAVPLRAVGAMPLTAYTVQLLVMAVLAAAFAGSVGDLVGLRALEPFWPLTLALLLGCTAWVALLGRGPLEALFDRVVRWVTPDPRDPAPAPPVARLEG